MKLLLQGKTESYGSGDDPFAVTLPGESRPVKSSDIGKYVNNEFFYYYKFYLNCKHSGPPLPGGWAEWPPWVCQLLLHFDNAVDTVRRCNELEAYRQAGRG